MSRFDLCAHGRSCQAPCGACVEQERRFEDETQRLAEEAFDDDPGTLTQVFPDGFSAPCERCGGPSLGDRCCVECEMRWEACS